MASAPKPQAMPCVCVHAFQDRKYGQGKRLHNPKAGKSSGWRCTVCAKEK